MEIDWHTVSKVSSNYLKKIRQRWIFSHNQIGNKNYHYLKLIIWWISLQFFRNLYRDNESIFFSLKSNLTFVNFYRFYGEKHIQITDLMKLLMEQHILVSSKYNSSFSYSDGSIWNAIGQLQLYFVFRLPYEWGID